jgi:hypothetical protein
MSTYTELPIRELDHRCSDGIDVTLLWDASSNRVYLSVEDARLGESFRIEVPAGRALDAFRHPYAYTHFDPVYGVVAA